MWFLACPRADLLPLHFIPTLFLGHCWKQLSMRGAGVGPGSLLGETSKVPGCYIAQDGFSPPEGHSALRLKGVGDEAASAWLRKQIQPWQHLRAFGKLRTRSGLVLFPGPLSKPQKSPLRAEVPDGSPAPTSCQGPSLARSHRPARGGRLSLPTERDRRSPGPLGTQVQGDRRLVTDTATLLPGIGWPAPTERTPS